MGKLKCLLTTQLLKHLVKGKTDPYIWVFSSVDNCHYNYNSRYLFEYVREHVPEVRPYFVINDPELRRKLGEKYGENYFIETESAQGMRKVLGAGVWFTSAGLPVYGTNLKKNRIIVNLWHGVPLKKIALLDPNLKPWTRIYFRKIFSENYSYVLTTSQSLVSLMARSFAVPENKIKVWGQPRNDGLFKQIDRNAWLKKILGNLPEYKKAVLYAPTFRDYGGIRLFPFKDFEKKKFEEFLKEEGILLLLRTHISEKGTADVCLSNYVRCLGSEMVEDITGYLGAFDCLITDYSSIYVDYLIINRPLIFLPYDKETFLNQRGMNFDYMEMAPGPMPETMEEFMECLKECAEGKDSWEKERCRVNDLFNEVREPCAGKICEYIFQEITAGTDEEHKTGEQPK